MTDRANVVAIPPLVAIGGLGFGAALEWAFPSRVLSRGAALAAGAALILVSIPIAISAVRALAKAQTAIDVRRPTTSIVETHAFRFSRNPIYLSMMLLYAGLSLLMNSAWPLLLGIFVFAIFQVGIVGREERYLEEKFGDSYRLYKKRVRRWI